MGSYVEGVLTSSETIVYQAEISMWAQARYLVWGVVLTPVFGIGLLLLLAAYIHSISTELVITNRRVIAKFGFIRRNTIEINLNKIESIQVHQGLIARIFDFGSLVLSGAGNPQAPIPGICRPLEFRKRFMEAQEASVRQAA